MFLLVIYTLGVGEEGAGCWVCRDSNRYRVDNGDSSDTGQVSPVELCGSGDRVRVLHCTALWAKRGS